MLGVSQYSATIRVLERDANWIEKHKVTKPTEFYAVIKQLEIWKKGKKLLIIEAKERIKVHERTLEAIREEFGMNRFEAEKFLEERINPSKREQK